MHTNNPHFLPPESYCSTHFIGLWRDNKPPLTLISLSFQKNQSNYKKEKKLLLRYALYVVTLLDYILIQRCNYSVYVLLFIVYYCAKINSDHITGIRLGFISHCYVMCTLFRLRWACYVLAFCWLVLHLLTCDISILLLLSLIEIFMRFW